MKRLLFLLLAALALPTAVNALSFEDKLEICAQHYANQITNDEAFNRLGLIIPENFDEMATTLTRSRKKSVLKESIVLFYCSYFRGK